MTTTVQALVHTLRFEADDVISVELRPTDGASFAAFDAGAHIDLHLPNGMVRSYSLINPCSEHHRYVVAVLKDRASRGGSRCVHEQLRVGMQLPITLPRNNFKLHEDAAHSVLLAGGIGITPILCMAQRLKALGRSFEVTYLARSRKSAAFCDALEALGAPVHFHFDDAQGFPDLQALLAARKGGGAADTHYYACGPSVMLDAFASCCSALGYNHAHIERFAAVAQAAATDALRSYEVELKRKGIIVQVDEDQTLLQALSAANACPMTSCEEGICGTCETRVLEGVPDHRDSILSEEERASNQVMMICVGGSKSARLVLDL